MDYGVANPIVSLTPTTLVYHGLLLLFDSTHGKLTLFGYCTGPHSDLP